MWHLNRLYWHHPKKQVVKQTPFPIRARHLNLHHLTNIHVLQTKVRVKAGALRILTISGVHSVGEGLPTKSHRHSLRRPMPQVRSKEAPSNNWCSSPGAEIWWDNNPPKRWWPITYRRASFLIIPLPRPMMGSLVTATKKTSQIRVARISRKMWSTLRAR